MPQQSLSPIQWLMSFPLTAYPLLFALLIFALSWLRPRPWVDLEGAGSRRTLLRRTVLSGSLLILLPALSAQIALTFSSTLWLEAGWWVRPLPLALTALAVAGIGLALTGTSRPPGLAADATAERVTPSIVPRRSWYTFAPRLALWLGTAAAALIAAACVWQGLQPRHPGKLPELGGDQGTFHMGGGSAIGPDWAFGWFGNAPALASLALLLLLWYWVLAADANRPLGGAMPANLTKIASARVVSIVALAGLVLSLGVIWSQLWAPASWAVFMNAPDGTRGRLIGSDYRGLVDGATMLGRVLEGPGLALLARLAIDSLRPGRRACATPGEDTRALQESAATGVGS